MKTNSPEEAPTETTPKKNGPGLKGKIGLSLSTLIILFVIIEVILRGQDLSFSLETDPNYDRSERHYWPNDARRNPYIQPGEEPGLKIGIVGDSFTNGAGVQFHDKYGVRLEQLLNMNSNVAPAAVYIAAKGGTSTYDHYRYLEGLFEKHGKPDVVVLGICLNDAEDQQNNKVHIAWRNEALPRAPEGLMAGLCKVSKLASFGYSKKEFARAMTMHDAYYHKLYQEDYVGYQKFEASIRLIKEAMDEQDVKFFAMIWPLLSDLNSKTYTFDPIHEKVHQVLEKNDVPYVDLKPHFTGKNRIRMSVIPFVDGHPNEIAHRIASEALLRELLKQGMIPHEYDPVHNSGIVTKYYKPIYQRLNPTDLRPPEKK